MLDLTRRDRRFRARPAIGLRLTSRLRRQARLLLLLLRFLRPLLTRMTRSWLLIPRLDRLAVWPAGGDFKVRVTLMFVLDCGRSPLLLLLRQLRRRQLHGDCELILRRRYLADCRRGIRLLHVVVNRLLTHQPVSGHGAFTLRTSAITGDYVESSSRSSPRQLIIKARGRAMRYA